MIVEQGYSLLNLILELLSRISRTSCIALAFLLFAPMRCLILADKEGAVPMGTFSADETLLEEDLLVAEGGLGFFFYGDTSLDSKVATSSLMDLLLAFLFSRDSVEDSSRSAGRSSKFEPCSFHFSTSSTGGRPLALFRCSLSN
ncbi:hypothetical protein ACE6H2_023174 [Prunus campanulata]